MGRCFNTVRDLPELEGWSTTTQVATRLGVTRQSAIQWALDGKFPNAKRISEIILIPDADIDEFEVARLGNPRRARGARQDDFPQL